jgi:hypothetical protein
MPENEPDEKDIPEPWALLASEVVCSDCNYAYHKYLPECPECKELRR